MLVQVVRQWKSHLKTDMLYKVTHDVIALIYTVTKKRKNHGLASNELWITYQDPKRWMFSNQDSILYINTH